MFRLFGRSKDKPHRDIEEVIFDIAEYHREEDFHVLYDLLKGRELYLPIDASSMPTLARPGIKYETKAGDQLKAKTVLGPNKELLVPAATQTSCSILAGGYVGIVWTDFLDMVMKVETVHGALIQGKTSWVGFDKERIKYVLNWDKA